VRAAILWRVYGCAALCAAGVACGLVYVMTEAGYHHEVPGQALRTAGSALAVGVVLGLWLPRRLIRRRLSGTPAVSERVRDVDSELSSTGTLPLGRVEYEFAAALTGTLVLALGLTWALTAGLAASLEGWRGVVVSRLLLPGWLMRAVLLTPLGLALVLLGVVGTTALVALHGWYRLQVQSRLNLIGFWLATLAAGALAAAVCSLLESSAGPALAAPLATFLGGIVAVSGRVAGAGAADLSVDRQGALNDLWRVLLGVGVVGFLAGGTLALLGASAARASQWGQVLLAVAGGAFVGTALATPFRARVQAVSGAALCILVGAAALFLAHPQSGGAVTGLWRGLVAGAALAACAVLTARRASAVLGGPQPALAWVGVVVAVGVGLGLAVAPGSRPRAMHGLTSPRATQASVRGLLNPPGLRTVVAALHWGFAGPALCSAWDLDLTGPRWDVIILDAAVPAGAVLRDCEAHRLVTRARAALRAGGRLVVEAPGPSLRGALRRHWTEVYVLRIRGRGAQYDALLCGPDVPAWVEALPALPGYDIDLHALPSAEEVEAWGASPGAPGSEER
jgi:hypothetical protein